MKVVGLIGDTHVPDRARVIPWKALEALKGADTILHVGDLTEFSVLDTLRQVAPRVLAVRGNMDPEGVRSKLPKMVRLQVEGVRIGAVHEPPIDARKLADEEGLRVIVYGHLHKPFVRRDGETLLVNPGSPVMPLPPFIVKPTVGLLRVEGDKVEAEIVRLR